MAQIFESTYEELYDFNVDLDEIDETFPIAHQPPFTNIPLKIHQLSLLKRCVDVENNVQYLQNYKSLKTVVNEKEYFSTKVGIIADRVGSGKSYVILSLILTNDITKKDDVIIKSCGMNNIVFNLSPKKQSIHTNILVIPHNLSFQWPTYINMFTNKIKYILLNKKHMADLLDDKLKVEDYNLIIVTSTFYNKFATHFADKNIRFQRVIFDEVDSINVPGCKTLDNKFLWLVTASYKNLIYPRGFTKWDTNVRRYIVCASGINSSGFLKNILIDLYNSIPKQLMKLIVLKNSEEYIEKSITLAEIKKNIIRCKTPRTIRILDGIVDKTIIECLNADDITGALSHVSVTNKGSEENIVDLMITKYTKNLSNLKLKLSIVESYTYDNETEKKNEFNKITSKIKEEENKIKMIKERINESDSCCICYDDFQNKTITNCCQNSFCFKCINIWLNMHNVCPMCKTPLTPNDMYSVVDGVSLQIPDEKEEPNDDDWVAHDKQSNLKKVLSRMDASSKILIFSNNECSLHSLHSVLDSLRMKYSHLKGNGNVIRSMVDKYKNGDTNVLLVNSRHYGSGLNLENTTDIIMFHKFDNEVEKQVIGRAHRLGRKEPLNLWYFLYTNEVASE